MATSASHTIPQLPYNLVDAACGGLPPPGTPLGLPVGVKIGEGATGEVFRGALDVDIALAGGTQTPGEGAPIAVKRLKLPVGVLPEQRIALLRAFRRELAVLSLYRHHNIVRLRACAIDESREQYALVYELMEGGSLDARLRSPQGAAPPMTPPLSPLARVEIALGITRGLLYLHGLEEDGAVPGAPRQPALHRDVKAANVGLTAECVPTLLDCGVAKAMRGDADAGDATGMGFSRISGGAMVSTAGYAPPEVADGQYNVRSEVYSFGVVLYELLTGQRVAASTMRELRGTVRRGGGPAIVAQRADGSGGEWPPFAVMALAELLLDCTETFPEDRPENMHLVLERLLLVRGMLTAEPLLPCVVCNDGFPAAQGIVCGAAPRHFTCRECLQGWAREEAGLERVAESGGAVRCPWRGAVGAGVVAACVAEPWDLTGDTFEGLLEHATERVL